VDVLVQARDVADGLSNTLMVAEKAYNAAYYKQAQFGDGLGYTSGFGVNTLRSGARPPVRDFYSDIEVSIDRFGSAHPYSMNALFCDGSVRAIRYDLPDDPQVLQVWSPLLLPFNIQALPSPPYPPYSMPMTLMQRLCHRADGGTIQLQDLE
jgi:prepilin-type processing-associated H-X9-DG protein